MTEKEPQMNEKGERLKKYLQDLEWYQFEIKELFIAGEINQQDYSKMMADSQDAYKQFLSDLKKDNESTKRGDLGQSEQS